MNIEDSFDAFAAWGISFGMPIVQCYHALCGSVFLNTAAEDAKGLEYVGNVLLAPTQYLLAGNKALRLSSQEILDFTSYQKDHSQILYKIEQRFEYNDSNIWLKTAASYVALPTSLILGSLIKAVAYCIPETRLHHQGICFSKAFVGVKSNHGEYRRLGIEYKDLNAVEQISCQNHQRRPGDEKHLQVEKEALKEIIRLLEQNKVIHWLDCGTCLGAYRYGGIIPWDNDIDIAVLQPDFDNVKQVLQALDPEKYIVQDWSSRDKPKTYLKVYVKEANALIDIYHFEIDEQLKQVHSILSNGDCVFLPSFWKVRESRYCVPTGIELIFPLKKIDFDGIIAFVPNQTEKYLQLRFGQNISPAKVYNETTQCWEKDLSHPYWNSAYAH